METVRHHCRIQRPTACDNGNKKQTCQFVNRTVAEQALSWTLQYPSQNLNPLGLLWELLNCSTHASSGDICDEKILLESNLHFMFTAKFKLIEQLDCRDAK
jgi:hypothetical protein